MADELRIDPDKVEQQVKALKKLADALGSASDKLGQVRSQQNGTAWTGEGSPDLFALKLNNNTETMHENIVAAAQHAEQLAVSLRAVLDDVEHIDEERRAELDSLLATTNDVIAKSKGPASTPPASQQNDADSPW